MGRPRRASGKDAALADLARLKSSGRTGRAADYEVKEQDDVYDEVDDQTYAEHAARQRAAVRDFVERGGGGHGEGSDSDGSGDGEDADAFYDEEEEFAMEDEMSKLHGRDRDSAALSKRGSRGKKAGDAGAGSKRRRGTAAARKSGTGAPGPRRVSAAFFGGFGGPAATIPAAPNGAPEDAAGTDARPLVFDPAMLDREMDDLFRAKKARREQRKANKAAAIGDLMFDEPTAGAGARLSRGVAGDLGLGAPRAPATTAVPTIVDLYAAPPPMLDGGPDAGQTESPDDTKVPKTAAKLLAASDTAADAAEESVGSGTAKAVGVDRGDDPMDVEESEADSEEKIAKPSAVEAIPKADQSTAFRASQERRLQASIAVAAATAKANVSTAPLRSSAPLARDDNGDLLMFWTDAHEVRVNGGEHLYLFGKAPLESVDSGVYASVCVLVKGVEREMYVLPRKGSHPLKDVYPEVSSRLLAGKAAGAMHGSNLPPQVRAKVVQRMCPFGDSDAPREPTEYLKVKFPFQYANNFVADSMGQSFQRVYGMKTAASETLCLKRGLKGPSWIRLSDAAPHGARISHARHCLFVNSPSNISIAAEMSDTPPPPLSSLCLSTKAVLNPKSGAHELVMISGFFVPDVPLDCALDPTRLESGAKGTREFVVMRSPNGSAIPFGFQDRARASAVAGGAKIEIVPNEAVLLNNFVAKLLQLDPDALVGHDMLGFGLDVLLARMAAQRTRKWSCLGRLLQNRDLSSVVKNNASTSWFKAEAVAGRLVCDSKSSAMEILYKEKDYSLAALSENVLGFKPSDPAFLPPATDIDNVPVAFRAADDLSRLVNECSSEARTAGRLSARLSILPLSKQLTCISGNLWSRTLQGARAQRIEFLLCHEFLKVGSKKGGDKSKAGNTTCKLLLPDKLSRVERARLEAMVHSRHTSGASGATPSAKKAKPEPRATPSVTAPVNAGFGGGFETTPDAKTVAGGDAGPTGTTKGKSTRRKPQYSGGLVLEPKKGLYDRYVLQLDFNSLYPSIIQEFNICFTTLELTSAQRSRSGDNDPDFITEGGAALSTPGIGMAGGVSPAGASMFDLLPDASVGVGVLPRVLRELVSQRRQVKIQLKNEKDPVKKSQLDIRQTAIKLTANSLYGCLGFEGSRFYAQTLAALVTSQGRHTLQNTVTMARDDFNAEVIYGDTDSLFVYTGLDDINRVRDLGMQLKRSVNAKYKTLEIEIDAIYSKMLLLKKKKYAAMKVLNPLRPDDLEREVKGLDLVRHDWCDLSHIASDHFLQQIFAGKTSNVDEAVGVVLTFLEELATQVRHNQMSLQKYVITKSLTKDPSQYPDGKNLPHVQVAMRLKNSGRRVGAGDYIKYVVCKPRGDGTKTSGKSEGVAAMAYHPDEVMSSKGELVVNVEYYLENQVLPPILRLCDPIESVDVSRLALAMGLSAQKYIKRESQNDVGCLSGLDMFRDADPFEVTCRDCKKQFKFEGFLFDPAANKLKSTGLTCAHCFARLSDANIANCMTMHIRRCVSKYYSEPYRLNGDDGTRARDTRNVSLGGNAALAQRACSERWLYIQLRQLRFLMDVQGFWRRRVEGDETGQLPRGGSSAKKEEADRIPLQLADIATYDSLFKLATRALDANGYRLIDLSTFLAPLGLS